MRSTERMLRIALNELGGTQWTGGITYRNNLLKALRTCPGEAEVFVISSDDRAAAGEHVIHRRAGGGISRKWNAAAKRLLKRDLELGRTLKDVDIDVVFPATIPGRKGMAAVYWIPDFQYRHLPHLYPEAQLRYFDVKLARYFSDASLVVVSSKDAEKDLHTFFPAFAGKTRVLSFVAHVPDDLYDQDPAAVAASYHLPPDFIYLPNQFWAHKNHSLVVDALHLLKQRGVAPFVVCTGNPVDERAPLHLAQLLLKISERGLRDRIALLGMVPHEHVYALMRQSKCVLNPSHFEGWSTSVEEAKSVGKRVLVSDIPVHREQDAPGAVYFDRHDPADLAAKLEHVWHEVAAGPDRALEEAARAALPARMQAFARTFLEIGREAVEQVQ